MGAAYAFRLLPASTAANNTRFLLAAPVSGERWRCQPAGSADPAPLPACGALSGEGASRARMPPTACPPSPPLHLTAPLLPTPTCPPSRSAAQARQACGDGSRLLGATRARRPVVGMYAAPAGAAEGAYQPRMEALTQWELIPQCLREGTPCSPTGRLACCPDADPLHSLKCVAASPLLGAPKACARPPTPAAHAVASTKAADRATVAVTFLAPASTGGSSERLARGWQLQGVGVRAGGALLSWHAGGRLPPDGLPPEQSCLA